MKITDDLYRHFEEHLHSLDVEKESQAEFIIAVVESYWQQISTKGHVGLQYEIEVREDIESEVEEMLQKKIYGFYSLAQYVSNMRKRDSSH